MIECSTDLYIVYYPSQIYDDSGFFMSEKPKSALNAMLARIIEHSDALHEELHELEDELSHHVSHLLKKIAKLTAYAELEASDRQSSEAVSLIARNMAEIHEDLTDLLDDAGTDPAIYAVGEAVSKLVVLMNAEWHDSSRDSEGEMPEAGDPREAFQNFESVFEKLIPSARADIAVRHAYLALREMAKFWRADDDRLASLGLKHDHDHKHGHQHEITSDKEPHNHEEI